MKSQITNSIPVEKTPQLEIETQGKKNKGISIIITTLCTFIELSFSNE